jgi:hypothetical protein
MSEAPPEHDRRAKGIIGLLNGVQSKRVRDVLEELLFVELRGDLRNLMRRHRPAHLGRARTHRIQLSFYTIPISLEQCNLRLSICHGKPE